MLTCGKAKVLIGTSGWVYAHWKGDFYPKSLPATEELTYYAGRYDTVELNNSFYMVPSTKSYQNWASLVPKRFLFSVKASRYLTHNKKLKDPGEPWKRMVEPVLNLNKHLGPILLQFPPHWQKNSERLAAFMEFVNDDPMISTESLVFEFRNESWDSEDVYDLLQKYQAAFCIADSDKFKRFNRITSKVAYIRYHGRAGARGPNYTRAQLKREMELIREISTKVRTVYVYFNNDTSGYAIRNADTLIELLS